MALAGAPPAFGADSVPVFERSDFLTDTDPAYLSNGLIGIRPGPIPLLPSPAYAAGFVYPHPQHRVECLSPAPYPLTTDIRVNGTGLLGHPEAAQPQLQRLDMNTAELSTRFVLEGAGGLRVDVQVVQFASRSIPSVLWQEIRLTPSAAMRIEVVPQLVFDRIPGTLSTTPLPARAEVELAALFHSAENLSRLGIAVRVQPDRRFTHLEGSHVYTLEASGGDEYTFVTLASLVSSFYHTEPEEQAIRMANWALQTGPENLREKNRASWRDLWRSRVVIDGDRDDQRVLDAGFFYLHSSLHRSNLNGMPPFGLSQSEHYFGHSFWDTESWSFLPVLLAAPDTAESLLDLRVRSLPAVHRAAGLFGYRGLQFPWEAAPTRGQETTPVFAATGWAEQHIVPDVALAFWQHAMATGDPDFLRQKAWPVLRGVAQWIESRGEVTQRGFEIHNIMGPNEAANGLNNSAYVNLACRMAMTAAVECAHGVGFNAPAAWTRIANSLYLPIDGRGVLMTSEGSADNAFADLSFLEVFSVALNPDVVRRTFEAFRREPRREHTIGFATAAVAGLTAKLGDRQRAAELFRQSWAPFWLEPYGMIREAVTQNYGCFLTDYGSILQTAMLDFTGIRIADGQWSKYDATLPSNWRSIDIGRIYVRGEPKSVSAQHGRKARISNV
jgi:trehalose/maltose hydrolase-like predicted phosphorylase